MSAEVNRLNIFDGSYAREIKLEGMQPPAERRDVDYAQEALAFAQRFHSALGLREATQASEFAPDLPQTTSTGAVAVHLTQKYKETLKGRH